MYRPRDLPPDYYYFRLVAYNRTYNYIKKHKPKMISDKAYFQHIQETIDRGKNKKYKSVVSYMTFINDVLDINKNNKKKRLEKIMFLKNKEVLLDTIDTSHKEVVSGVAIIASGIRVYYKAFGDNIKKISKLEEGESVKVNGHIQISQYKDNTYINLIIDEIVK